jgi:hypothetical protein
MSPPFKKNKCKIVKDAAFDIGLTKVQMRKALPLLHAVCHMSDEERISLFEHLNEDGRQIVYHCIFNGIYNKCISKKKRVEICQKLGDQKKIYEYLAKPTNHLDRKKKLLKQTGAGLPLILSAVLPILSALLSK